jgi:hypothetical protein
MVKNYSSKHLLVSLFIVFLAFNLFSSVSKLKDLTTLNLNTLKDAVSSINSAKTYAESLDLDQAATSFNNAATYFLELKNNSLHYENNILSPQEISEAGVLISSLGQNLTETVSDLKDLPNQFFESNKQVFLKQQPENLNQQTLTQSIFQTKTTIEKSISDLNKATDILKKQSYQLLPKPLKAEYQSALDKLQEVHDLLYRVDALLGGSLDLLGHQTPHRYLILLQNQNELRPLGGFLGSVMTLEVDQGIVQNIKFQDIYDIDGQAQKTLDVPPELNGFTSEVFSRDANFSPIPEVSINQIQDLFNHSKQPNYRSYVVLNHNFLSKLLQKAGPLQVNLEGSNYTLTDTNFSLILNTIVELDQNKDVVASVIQAVQSHIFQNLDINDFVEVTHVSLLDRDFQFFTENKTIQSEFDSLPFYQPISSDTNTDQDYLMITETNIGGNKSDKYIETKVSHSTNIQNKIIQNTVEISKTHTYSNQTEIVNNSILAQNNIASIPDELRYILGRGTNKSMTKLYVPRGSKLVAFSGDFTKVPEIYEDNIFNKSYILFETTTAPQETSTVQITYEPKIKIPKATVQLYHLLVQKSSGLDYSFQKVIKSEDNSTRINSPSFPTDTNQIFEIKGSPVTINQDTTFQTYFFN